LSADYFVEQMFTKKHMHKEDKAEWLNNWI